MWGRGVVVCCCKLVQNVVWGVFSIDFFQDFYLFKDIGLIQEVGQNLFVFYEGGNVGNIFIEVSCGLMFSGDGLCCGEFLFEFK